MLHHADVFQDRLGGSNGFRWLEQKVHAFVRGDEKRRGPLREGDRDDVNQEVHYKLLCEWGEDYPHRIEGLCLREAACSVNGGNSRDEPDRLFVVDIINRTIAKTHWKADKRRQRGLPEFVPFSEDIEESSAPESAETIDLAVDIRQCLESLSPLERTIWHGRVEGKTVQELGRELGLDFRRVSEIAGAVIAHIASILHAGPSGRHITPLQPARRG